MIVDDLSGMVQGLMIVSSIAIVIFLLVFVAYALMSVGIYRIVKYRSKSGDELFAFIPLFGLYLIGFSVDHVEENRFKGMLGYIIGVSLIASLMFPIFLVVFVFALMYGIYLLYKDCGKSGWGRVILHTVTLGLVLPIDLFMLGGRIKKDYLDKCGDEK